jgi:hypothetical protein
MGELMDDYFAEDKQWTKWKGFPKWLDGERAKGCKKALLARAFYFEVRRVRIPFAHPR